VRRYGYPFIMRMAVTVAAWPGICGLFGGEDGDFKCAAFVLGSSMSFLSSRGWLVGRGVGCWGGNSGRLEGVWRVKWQEFQEADVEVLFRGAGISKGLRRCWLGMCRPRWRLLRRRVFVGVGSGQWRRHRTVPLLVPPPRRRPAEREKRRRPCRLR